MEQLLKNDVVRMKIKSLSSPVRKAFIESLLDLYEQETEEMIDVIEESRMELRGHYLSFEDESKSLRAESRMLEDRRNDPNDKYLRKGISSRNSDSQLSYIDEQTNSKSIDHLRKRGKRRPPIVEDMRSKSTDIRAPHDRRGAESALSTRSLPTPIATRTVEEEKDEVMKNLSTANRQNEVERQRQAELIAQRREKRRQQKQTTEEKALELLEKALAMDKRLQDKKQEQEQKVKERLEDMKRKRTESRMGGPIAEEPTERSREKTDEHREKPRQSDTTGRSDKSDRHRERTDDRPRERKDERPSSKSAHSDNTNKREHKDRPKSSKSRDSKQPVKEEEFDIVF